MKWLTALFAWAVFILPLIAAMEESREPDVLYFDQNLPEKIVVTLEKNANVYLDKDLQTLAAALPPGTKVQILGLVNDGNYFVSTKYRGTRIEGWAFAGDFPPIDSKLIETAKKSQAWRESVQRAIKEKRVVQGMTFDDVKKSLGKPDRTSSRQDAQTKFDTWTFITYELVPQNSYVTDAWGRVTIQTIYVKKPIGELTVEFNNGIVTGIEEHRRQRE